MGSRLEAGWNILSLERIIARRQADCTALVLSSPRLGKTPMQTFLDSADLAREKQQPGIAA
jgi:hypothetical protein